MGDAGDTGGRTALLVVDVLDDAGHAAADRTLPGLRRAASAIASALSAARARGWRVVFVNDDHGEDDPGRVVSRALSGPGRDVVRRLAPAAGEPVVLKRAYSGFDGTRLAEVLDAERVGRVVVAGAVTEMCVEATAVDAAARGYRTWVVATATVGLDPVASREATANLRDRGVAVVGDLAAVGS